MATQIPVQDMPANGASLDDLAYTAADITGMWFYNDTQCLLLVKSEGAPGDDVTVLARAALDSGLTVDQVITAVADGLNMAGPFAPRNFNQSGKVNMTIGTATNVEVAVVRCRPALSG